MKKCLFIAASLIILSLTVCIAQDNHSRLMTIRMNGHDYQVHDFISDTISTLYDQYHASINSQLSAAIQNDANGTNIGVSTPNIPSIIFSPNKFEINIGSTTDKCWIGFNKGDCRFDAYFIIAITGQLQAIGSSITNKINISNVQCSVKDFTINGHADISWLEWLGGGWVYAAMCKITSWYINNFGFLDSYKISLLSNVSIDLFNASAMNPNLNSNLVTEVLNGFPIRLDFSGTQTGDLVISMNFMEGTETNPSQFVGIDPGSPAHSTFNYMGFGCPYNKFQNAFNDWQDSYKPDGNASEYYSTLLASMKNYSTQSIRISFPWRDIFGDGKIPIVSGHTVSELTTSILNEKISEIPQSSWVGMDSIIAHAYRLGFDVIPQLLQQESDQPLLNGGTIVPDSTRRDNTNIPSPNGWHYQFVDGETYLYYTKIFANAVVRRYRNDVAIWALESELNAKRLLVMYDWMQGNLFKDESPGGFQDRLWCILVDAVKKNDSTAKIMTNFHLLNLMKGIQRFGYNLDIVGVDVYPNIVFAEPVMGFAVGEVVWAARRALKGLGWDQKVVHVAECAYPGIVNNSSEDTPSGMGLSDRIQWFSYGRQAKFMRDAIQTSLEYGAQGFFYWGFLDTDNSNNKDGNLGYGSLIVKDTKPLQFKDAAGAFQGKVATTHPGKSPVTLTNRSVFNPTGNLGNYVALSTERDSLISGSSVNTTKSWNHVSQTYQQFIQGLKHQSWNQYPPEFYLKQNFVPTQLSTSRTAYFAGTNLITLRSSYIDGGAPSIACELNDPWQLDASGEQPGNIFLLKNTGTNVDVFLGQEYEPLSGKPYYQVRAPQTINGVPTTFLGWEYSGARVTNPTSSTSPVIFDNAGATVTAKYKGRLISTTSLATATDNGGIPTSNQRKVAIDNDRTIHTVYVSGGMVFYTHSGSDNEGNFIWTPEFLIGTGKNPSISVTWNNDIHVIWEQDLGGGNRNVFYRRSTDNGTTWQSAITLATFNGAEATPVVFGYSLPIAVWRQSDGLYLSLYPYNATAAVKLDNTNSLSKLPSGTQDYNTIGSNIDRRFYVVYTNGTIA